MKPALNWEFSKKKVKCRDRRVLAEFEKASQYLVVECLQWSQVGWSDGKRGES